MKKQDLTSESFEVSKSKEAGTLFTLCNSEYKSRFPVGQCDMSTMNLLAFPYIRVKLRRFGSSQYFKMKF
jgi:hypothetical protein